MGCCQSSSQCSVAVTEVREKNHQATTSTNITTTTDRRRPLFSSKNIKAKDDDEDFRSIDEYEIIQQIGQTPVSKTYLVKFNRKEKKKTRTKRRNGSSGKKKTKKRTKKEVASSEEQQHDHHHQGEEIGMGPIVVARDNGGEEGSDCSSSSDHDYHHCCARMQRIDTKKLADFETRKELRDAIDTLSSIDHPNIARVDVHYHDENDDIDDNDNDNNEASAAAAAAAQQEQQLELERLLQLMLYVGEQQQKQENAGLEAVMSLHHHHHNPNWEEEEALLRLPLLHQERQNHLREEELLLLPQRQTHEADNNNKGRYISIVTENQLDQLPPPPYSEEATKNVVLQILRAVDYLERRGIIQTADTAKMTTMNSNSNNVNDNPLSSSSSTTTTTTSSHPNAPGCCSFLKFENVIFESDTTRPDDDDVVLVKILPPDLVTGVLQHNSNNGAEAQHHGVAAAAASGLSSNNMNTYLPTETTVHDAQIMRSVGSIAYRLLSAKESPLSSGDIMVVAEEEEKVNMDGPEWDEISEPAKNFVRGCFAPHSPVSAAATSNTTSAERALMQSPWLVSALSSPGDESSSSYLCSESAVPTGSLMSLELSPSSSPTSPRGVIDIFSDGSNKLLLREKAPAPFLDCSSTTNAARYSTTTSSVDEGIIDCHSEFVADTLELQADRQLDKVAKRILPDEEDHSDDDDHDFHYYESHYITPDELRQMCAADMGGGRPSSEFVEDFIEEVDWDEYFKQDGGGYSCKMTLADFKKAVQKRIESLS